MKNIKFIAVLASLVLVIILWGCYYDNEEELYPALPDKTCDTLNVTYDTHISKIMSESCVSCHGANYQSLGGGYKLDNYEDVKNAMYEIVIAIERSDPNFEPMPQGAAKLSDCKINQFKIWERNGYPEK